MEEFYGIRERRGDSLFTRVHEVTNLENFDRNVVNDNNLNDEQILDPSWTRLRSYSPKNLPPTTFLQGGFWSLPQSQFQPCGPDLPKKELYSSVLTRGEAVSTEDVSCTSSSASNVSFASSTMTSASALERNPARYKTELCRPFQNWGNCLYGKKCQFAHGPGELRSVPRHRKYKTDLCQTYHSTGFCPYGPRCLFIHDELVETNSTAKNGQIKCTLNGAQENNPPSGDLWPPISNFSPVLFNQFTLSAAPESKPDFDAFFDFAKRPSETNSPCRGSPFQTDDNEDSNSENLSRLPVFSHFQ